jgi:hypothetical protein
MNADVIKTRLIDYLIAKNEDTIIGSEVAFGFNKNMADIVQLLQSKTYAFEIKGDKDDFRRLSNQIGLYETVFDYLYIVTTIKHIAYCHKLDETIGLILITPEKGITVVRNAKLQPQTDKREILETINSHFLKSCFNVVGNKTATEIREIVFRKNKKTIKDTLYDYFTFLIEPKFRIFLSEKGEQTHIEDVSLLSLYNRIIT